MKGRATLSDAILDRQPPCSLEAERGILGSILLKPDVCDDVMSIVRADDFYDDANRRIFRQMLAAREAGRGIDVTLLVERLKIAGELDAVGGTAYLFELYRLEPTAVHAAYYSEIVRDKSMLRSLIHSATEILRDAYGQASDPREVLNVAEQKLFRIFDHQTSTQVLKACDVVQESLARIDARMVGKGGARGIETGFHALDDLVGGFHDSELIIVAARTSEGKTSFALNFAEHAAIDLRLPTLFVSLEIYAVDLGDRSLSSLARVNSQRLSNGTIDSADRRKLVEAAAELSHAPLFFDDASEPRIAEIAATARRLKREQGLRLLIIDYLQLVKADNERDPRHEQVAKISRRMKELARQLRIPVVCLSQLNRQADASAEKKPRLSHLRESGAIEQDADLVLLLHRERNADGDPDTQGLATVDLAKNRRGPTGEVQLVWDAPTSAFRNRPPYDGFDAKDVFPDP